MLNCAVVLFQNPIEKIQFYMDHRREREQQILAALRNAESASCTVTDIVTAVYTVSIYRPSCTVTDIVTAVYTVSINSYIFLVEVYLPLGLQCRDISISHSSEMQR